MKTSLASGFLIAALLGAGQLHGQPESPTSEGPTSIAMLPVELVGQEQTSWCWAGCSYMIMEYFTQQSPTQCEQANFCCRNSDLCCPESTDCKFECDDDNCCSQPFPSACNSGAWPDLGHWGYSCEITPSGTALSWEQLKDQIDRGKPVLFSWLWSNGGGHMMVAIGYYDTSSAGQLVCMNDPWPVDEGERSLITYAQYVSDSSGNEPYTHWRDYYEITYLGHQGQCSMASSSPGVPPTSAERETVEPKSVAAPLPGLKDPRQAVRETLEMLSTLITDRGGQCLDPELLEGISDAKLGEPIPVFYVGLDRLRDFKPGQRPSNLLIEGGELIFPVMVKGRIGYSVVVKKREGLWRMAIIGRPTLTRDLTTTQRGHAAAADVAPDSLFVVHIPALYQIFIGHRVGRQLFLTPVYDHPELDIRAGVTRPGPEIFLRLVSFALEFKGGLPGLVEGMVGAPPVLPPGRRR